ncbi:MAG: hypothetical protein AB4206_07585, partial [Xenococcaceae cyanobacterium]
MNSLIDQFGKIVFHFDGNNNDPDDIAALPVAAMLVNSANLQADTAFFYGNNLSEKNEDFKVEKMRNSAEFAEKLGVDTFDYQSNIGATTDELVKIFNSGEKVLSIEGGPMEAVYRALEQTSSENRQNITLLSHSWWNENRDVITRDGVDEARTWSDLKQDFPDVTFIDIDDQNPGFYNDGWNWLDNQNDPVFKEARELMIDSNKRNDPSDAGMLFYALTGQENANPYDAKAFFEDNPPSFDSVPPNNPTPTPQPTPNNPVFQAQNGQVIIEAENTWLQGEWKKVTIDGQETVLWDGERSNYSGVDNGETLSYTFKTDEAGTYHLAMNSARERNVMSEDEKWRGDTGNDAFVSIVEADTGKVVRSPVKFVTYLGNSDRDLTWGNNFDINHEQIGASLWLNDDTKYSLEVSGRSDGFLIDRITLSNDGFLKSTSIPQSPTTGNLPAPNTPSPSENTYFIEAENMNLSGDYHTENNQFASGGKVISLYGGDGDNDDIGTASFDFAGSTGVYTIKVNYFDENDGVGQMKVRQNNNLLKSWNLDQELGSHLADEKTKTSLEIKNVEVSAGDEFQIEGMEQGSVNTAEHARLDGVEFI